MSESVFWAHNFFCYHHLFVNMKYRHFYNLQLTILPPKHQISPQSQTKLRSLKPILNYSVYPLFWTSFLLSYSQLGTKLLSLKHIFSQLLSILNQLGSLKLLLYVFEISVKQMIPLAKFNI